MAETDIKRLIEIGIDARKARQGGKEVERSMEGVSGATKLTRNEMGQFEKKTDMAGIAAKNLGRALMGLVASFSAMLIIRQTIREVIELETALVNLSKVSNLEGGPLESLDESIGKLARKLPGTKRELLDTASAAARLGVQGAADIESFTATIARFGAATGGLIGGDEAATQLARIINVTGEGVGVVEELAGAIALLGDNIAADEAEITRYTTQVAQATTLFEIGSVKAAAFAGTLAALGVRAELSGSSIGRAFRAIDRSVREGGKQMELLKAITGQTAEEIERTFSDEPAQMMVNFLDGLGRFIEEGGDAVKVLEGFGLQGEEVLKVLPTLAKSSDQLAASLALVSDKETNVGKLFEEVERSASTTAAGLERLRDTLGAIREMIGKKMLPALNSAADGLTHILELVFGMEKATTPAGRAMVLLARGLGLVATAIAVIIAIDLAKNLFLMAKNAGLLNLSIAGGLLPSLKAMAVSLTKVAALLGVAFTSFSIGSYFFEEFKVVQQVAQSAVAVITGAWEHIKYGFKLAVIGMQDAWAGFVRGMGFVLGAAIEDIGYRIVSLQTLLEGTVFEVDFGGKELASFGKALRDGALFTDLFDADAARAAARTAMEEAIDTIEEVQRIRFQEIEGEFGSLERKGESFADGVGRKMEANLESVVDAIDAALVKVEDLFNDPSINQSELNAALAEIEGQLDNLNADGLPELASNFEAINAVLEGTEDKASAALEAMRRLVSQLNIEADLIRRGVPGDQRERSLELLRVQEQLLKLTNEELDEILVQLNSNPPSLSDLIEDPEKLKKVQEALGLIGDKLDELRKAEKFEQFASDVGDAFGQLFDDLTFGAKSIEDAFESLIRNISRLVFEQLVTNQLSSFITGLLSPGLGSLFGSAKGNVFSDGNVVPFARGGVVSGPTIFPMANGATGLMGEAGPEAVLPLTRTNTGELGVKAEGGATRISVTQNIYTPDVGGVDRSRNQLIRSVGGAVRRAGA